MNLYKLPKYLILEAACIYDNRSSIREANLPDRFNTESNVFDDLFVRETMLRVVIESPNKLSVTRDKLGLYEKNSAFSFEVL